MTTSSTGQIPDSMSIPKPRGFSNTCVNMSTDWANLIPKFDDSGLKFMRFDALWSSIEKQPGIYDWTALDSCILGARKRGIRSLVIICYNNPLYYSDQEKEQYGSDYYVGFDVNDSVKRKAFNAWLNALVYRYKRMGIIWSIWNEPSLDYFWKPHANPKAYDMFTRMCYGIIKAVASTELVCAGSLAGEWGPFMSALLNLGTFIFTDAIEIHTYVNGVPELMRDQHYIPLRKMLDTNTHSGSQFIRSLPWINGECGWNELSVARINPEITRSFSDEHLGSSLGDIEQSQYDKDYQLKIQGVQADYWRRMLEIDLEFGVSISNWYRAQDTEEENPEDRSFGMFDIAGNPKPIFNTIKELYTQSKKLKLVD